MNLQLDHYAIYCFDLEKSVAFYSTVLGLQSKPRPNFDFPGHWFNIGNGQELHLISGRNELKENLSNTRNIHYAFKSDDIVAFTKHLYAHQIPKIGPKKRPDGVTQIFIQDPDGYWIEITE
jgi:lactoylglutathione lyase